MVERMSEMNVFEQIIFEPRGGMFREFEGLNTHFEPSDPSLYRKLLPEPLAMPSRPVVTIFVADYLRVAPWPMTRYQEWSVLLKSEWKGEEGWYSVTMPVTQRVAMFGGRYLGFPKYIADEISLVRSEEAYVATAKYKSVVQLTLEFNPSVTRQLASWEKELAENLSFFKGDALQLVPPGRGPRVQKIMLHHVIPPKWVPEHGMVCVQVSPRESWAGLVPKAGEFPGTHNHFVGGMNLIAA